MNINPKIWKSEKEYKKYWNLLLIEKIRKRKKFSLGHELRNSQWASLMASFNRLPKSERRKTYVHKPKKTNSYIDYNEYLDSSRWKHLRKKVRDLDLGRCVACNSTENLNAHHRTYKNLGTENEINDIHMFCSTCHKLIHKHRPIDGKIRCE